MRLLHTSDRCLTRAAGVDTTLVVLQRRTGIRPAPVRDTLRPERTIRASDGVVSGQDTVRMWEVGPDTLAREVALECAGSGKSRALKAWMKEHWNDATLALAAALGTRFESSAVRERSSLGQSLWLMGALPIRWTRATAARAERVNVGRVAAQVQYISRASSAPGSLDESAWNTGVRALAGKSNVNGFVELTRNLDKVVEPGERTAWASGIELMVAESIWISVGVGERYSELLDARRDFVFLNLHWGIAREARLTR